MLVRKLLLRGYKVKAMARTPAGDQENPKPLPPAVEVVYGDVGESADCWRAVQGVDKVPHPSINPHIGLHRWLRSREVGRSWPLFYHSA